MREVDLSVQLFGHEYANPLVVASGTLVERLEQVQPFVDAGVGAIVPRTTRKVMERIVHPSPHLHQFGAGTRANLINAEWTGLDIDYWRPHLDRIQSFGNVILGVSGRDVEGCVDVCSEIDDYDIPLIEINVGCGVTNGVIGAITRDTEHIKSLVSSIKDAGVKTPIALKLGHSDYIVELSKIAYEQGADAIVAVNTYGPVLDFEILEGGQTKELMGVTGGMGGLSGDSLFNIALTDVARISNEGIPVIASGGVNSPERVMKMICAGAYLVQVYTHLHQKGIRAPEAAAKMVDDFTRFANDLSVENMESIRGNALGILNQETNLEPIIPRVDEDICTGCDRCIPVCLPKSISIVDFAGNRNGHIVEVSDDSCVGCGHCVSVCPYPGALVMYK